MEPRGNKALNYFLAGLFGVVLPLVALDAISPQASQGAVDLLVEMSDTGGARLLPEEAEAFDIKPGVASMFYKRTIAGSPYREGKLDWDLLMSLIKDDKTPGPKILKLLPDVVVEFTPKSYKPIRGKQSVDSQKYQWAGRVTSKGKVVGEGLFIVDVKQKKMSATIDYNDKVYEIVPLKNGNLRIFELNATRFPEERPEPSNSPERDNPPLTESHRQALTRSDSQPCVIDVLVLYTRNAEQTWLNQGYEDIWWEFDKAIEITNEAFANSDIHAEVRIVDRKLILGFDESGMLDVDLGNLQNINQVKEWRDSARADLVSLWVAGGNWCGASPYFTNRFPKLTGEDGFSVVTVGCAAVIKSLAHEIGHNLGARHTRVDEHVSDSNTNYNFGHLSVVDAVRTIEALNTECRAKGVYCRRESHYSNPEIPYPGIGTMTGVRKTAPKAADNHTRLNTTACEAEAYR